MESSKILSKIFNTIFPFTDFLYLLQQEEYSFSIKNVIPYPDTSDLEGGEINYRADIAIMCLVGYQNILTAGYFNNFETAVTVASGSATMYQTFNPAMLPK